MKIRFGSPREGSDSDTGEPRDPSKRRTLKLLGATALVSAVGSSSESIPSTLGTFADRFNAMEQLRLKGITDFQRQAYKPGLSECLATGIQPFGYSVDKHDVLAEISRIAKAFTKVSKTQEERAEELITMTRDRGHFSEIEASRFVASRIDAWRTYLGLPQNNQTFGISIFKPEKGTDDIYYYKINGFIDRLIEEDRRYFNSPESTKIQRAVELAGYRDDIRTRGVDGDYNEDLLYGIMGGYTLSLGKDDGGDYLSYYDKWNLEGSLEGEEGIVGKPFEIYDRIYYNPETFDVIEPKDLSPEKTG